MFKKIKNKLKRIIDNYDRKHGWATVRDAMSYYVYPSGEPVTSIPNAYKYHAMFILFNIIPQNRFTIPLLRKFNNYRFRKQIENLEYYKRKWNLIPIETYNIKLNNEKKERYIKNFERMENDAIRFLRKEMNKKKTFSERRPYYRQIIKEQIKIKRKLMKIVVKSKYCSRENILKEYPDAVIFDVTSKGEYKTLSPFYPHGLLFIPFSSFRTSKSVEGIWQGLKVFEHEGIDSSCFSNDTMKNLKRKAGGSRGRCLGHQKGLDNKELLSYIEARKKIYVPSYFDMLKTKCQKELEYFTQLIEEDRTIVLLDYNTNEDIEDYRKPFSHASLIKEYLINNIFLSHIGVNA